MYDLGCRTGWYNDVSYLSSMARFLLVGTSLIY